jgi:hypothetical protein
MFHCDNEGATHAWEKLGSVNIEVLDLMRRMMAVAAEHNFTVTLKHIKGADNSIADAPSRFQGRRFRRLAPHASPTPVGMPDIFEDLQQTYR